MNLRVTMLVPGLARGGMTRAYSLGSALRVLGAEVNVVGALAQNEEIYPEPPTGVSVTPVAQSSFARRVRETRRADRGDVLYAIKPRVTSFGMAMLCRSGRRILLDIDDRETEFTVERPVENSAPWHRRVMRHARRRLERVRNPDDALYTGWMEKSAGRANTVTANTRLLCDHFGAVLVPSARDTTQFDPARFDPGACRRELGLEGMRVIMFPGTPRSHKGVEDVLEALALLDWPDARLVLVGGREVGQKYTKSLESQHGNRIVRLTRFGMEGMPAVVAAAHVVVVPQRDTPVARSQFPMKITDAMAMAKPILSTRVGDIPATLEGAAYLVEPSSPQEIARALEEIFADPEEAARRGREARRRCEQQFSTTAVAGILQGILEGRS
jgi:glycosyltransferase involved in cell wall biosynthesis